MKPKTKEKIKKGIIKKSKPFKPVIEAEDDHLIPCSECMDKVFDYEVKACTFCGKESLCDGCIDPERHICADEVST